jgi:hypothetical protein
MHGTNIKCTQYFGCNNVMEKDYLEDLGKDGRIYKMYFKEI